ncbi:uncharacterized protein LOC107969144 [Pan troglodytes]|uniref:uncharacterized protein LOC107969144 n=1 Tax=Pan troglodytes TaxID=9598 RepID=UPI0007DBBF6D|nr:uncharacterized protein LOC107969144 [Pan troglodytes]
MRSMKVALGNVGIQLSPQETFEALRQADLDGDGIISFLGVFLVTSWVSSMTTTAWLSAWPGEEQPPLYPQGLQTLFLEMLFKLLGRGFVPSKLARRVMRWAQPYQLLGPQWEEQTLPRAGTPDVPALETGALNSGSVSWAPSRPRTKTKQWLPALLWLPHL